MTVRKSDLDRYLEPDEVVRLLACAKGRAPAFYAAAVLMVNHGLRVGEVVALELAGVSDHGRSLRVRTLKQRRPVTHTLELRPAVARVVLSQVARARRARSPWLFPSPTDAQSPVSTRALQWQFRSNARRAGLRPGLTCHSLRHTRAMQLYQVSGDRLIVSHDLRHANPRSCDAYLSVDPQSYRRAARSVPTFT